MIGQFPNTEEAVLAWAKAATGFRGYTEIPNTWNTQPARALENVPCVVVERPPGGYHPSDFESAPQIDVTVFLPVASGRTAVWAAVQKLEAAIPSMMPGIGNVGIDDVSVPSGFGILPYDNPNVRRAVGTLQLVVRPQS